MIAVPLTVRTTLSASAAAGGWAFEDVLAARASAGYVVDAVCPLVTKALAEFILEL